MGGRSLHFWYCYILSFHASCGTFYLFPQRCSFWYQWNYFFQHFFFFLTKEETRENHKGEKSSGRSQKYPLLRRLLLNLFHLFVLSSWRHQLLSKQIVQMFLKHWCLFLIGGVEMKRKQGLSTWQNSNQLLLSSDSQFKNSFSNERRWTLNKWRAFIF